jgi:hypothetical protein
MQFRNAAEEPTSILLTGPIAEVNAVVKGTARLPCDIVPPVSNDSVFLVIWYKNDITPIYR